MYVERRCLGLRVRAYSYKNVYPHRCLQAARTQNKVDHVARAFASPPSVDSNSINRKASLKKILAPDFRLAHKNSRLDFSVIGLPVFLKSAILIQNYLFTMFDIRMLWPNFLSIY